MISVFSCPLDLYSAMGSCCNNLTSDSGILGIEGLVNLALCEPAKM